MNNFQQPDFDCFESAWMISPLGEGGFEQEARVTLLEALPSFARALAVENRLPEPATPELALLPPLSTCWKDALAFKTVHVRCGGPMEASSGLSVAIGNASMPIVPGPIEWQGLRFQKKDAWGSRYTSSLV